MIQSAISLRVFGKKIKSLSFSRILNSSIRTINPNNTKYARFGSSRNPLRSQNAIPVRLIDSIAKIFRLNRSVSKLALRKDVKVREENNNPKLLIKKAHKLKKMFPM